MREGIRDSTEEGKQGVGIGEAAGGGRSFEGEVSGRGAEERDPGGGLRSGIRENMLDRHQGEGGEDVTGRELRRERKVGERRQRNSGRR